MKKGIIKGAQSIGADKSYIPDETLVAFFQDWLHIHQKRDKLTKEGSELSDIDKKKLRELDRRKVYILDNIIFPSLANLTYFFEAMSSSVRLNNAFEDELKEILDSRKAKEQARFGGGGTRFQSGVYRENNLVRLLNGMLEIPMKNYSDEQQVDDFRLGLIHQILNIIGDKMDILLDHEYSSSQIWMSFYNDYKRMLGWSALLARSVKDEPKEYDRKLGFLPIWYSPKGGIHEIEF